MDQRKRSSRATNAKKAEAGRLSKGGGVFAPVRRNKSREDRLQERIEEIIRKASLRRRDSLRDVVREERI